MNKTEQHDKVFKALLAAQSEMELPNSDKTNPHYKKKYASLSAVLKAVHKVFPKNGLFFIQDTFIEEKLAGCITYICHESGQFISSEKLIIPVRNFDAQGCKSSITYARRISLQSMVGICEDDDDDGNASVGNQDSTFITEKKEMLF